MVEQRSPKPSVACSSRVSPAKKHISPLAVCVFCFLLTLPPVFQIAFAV